MVQPVGGAGQRLRSADAYRWVLGLSRVLERTTRWVLRNVSGDADSEAVIAANKPGLSVLRRQFSELVAGADRTSFERLVGEAVEIGAEADFARDMVTLRYLDQMLEIIRVARETDAEPADTARAFYRVSELLSVPWLRDGIYASARDDRWEQRAAQALADDLTRAHHRMVSQVMTERVAGIDIGEAASRLLAQRTRDVDRFRRLLEEIRAEDGMTLAGLSVAVREITVLSERVNLPGIA